MTTLQHELGLTDEQFGKLRLFNRVLISYNDFNQAHEIATLLVDGNLYQSYPRENRHLVMNMAAIIAYTRPFLDSGGELAHNRLLGRVLRQLTAEEMVLHKTVLEDRNTMMAHSDADANLSIPLVIETARGPLVIPKNASAYTTILLPESMQLLRTIALKLQEHCFLLRQQLEPELISFLPRAETGDDA
jgi:hypothetical protein